MKLTKITPSTQAAKAVENQVAEEAIKAAINNFCQFLLRKRRLADGDKVTAHYGHTPKGLGLFKLAVNGKPRFQMCLVLPSGKYIGKGPANPKLDHKLDLGKVQSEG